MNENPRNASFKNEQKNQSKLKTNFSKLYAP